MFSVIGIISVSVISFSRCFPFLLVCWLQFSCVILICALKSPFSMTLPCVFSLCICVLICDISLSTFSDGTFSWGPYYVPIYVLLFPCLISIHIISWSWSSMSNIVCFVFDCVTYDDCHSPSLFVPSVVCFP